MKISPYENLKINSFSKLDRSTGEWIEDDASVPRWESFRAAIYAPGETGGTGRVDHFMKKDIKSIVNAYVKQFVNREGFVGKHTVKIDLIRRDTVKFEVVERKTVEITIDNSK